LSHAPQPGRDGRADVLLARRHWRRVYWGNELPAV
jgi:hypothetical protein